MNVVQEQAARILMFTNALAAVSCFVIAATILFSSFARPEVFPRFYSYPFALALALLTSTFVSRFIFALGYRFWLINFTIDVITSVGVAVAAVHAFEMLRDIRRLPNPEDTQQTNKALARMVRDLLDEEERQ